MKTSRAAKRRWWGALVLGSPLAVGLVSGCGDEGEGSTRAELALAPECSPSSAASPGLKLTALVSGLDLPTYVTAAPGDAERLYVLEQRGRIRVVQGTAIDLAPFADLSDRVYTTLPAYSEYGLLGLAFHPDYATNGRVFIHYSSVAVAEAAIGPGDGVISEKSLDEVILSYLAEDLDGPTE